MAASAADVGGLLTPGVLLPQDTRIMIATLRPASRVAQWFVCLVLSLFLGQSAAAARAKLPTYDVQPIEDPAGRAMMGFYSALAKTERGEWVTRIVHYGDSHVAADILTGTLRRSLQATFGDSGAGFVLAGQPWQWYSRAGVLSHASSGWQADGLTQASIAADGRLGLAGISLSTRNAGESISLTATGRYFDVYVLEEPGGGAISISLDSVEETKFSLKSKTAEADYIEIVASDDSTHTIEIRTTSAGLTRIFGIAIEGERAGVVYDALGINGARASRPLLWNWDLLASNLERRDPDLIIVAYGSNEVTDSDLDLVEYGSSFEALLKRFHSAAPQASILVVGPPDRGVRAGRRWITVDRMSSLIDAQRRASRRAGAAFFDLFKAMGGPGSIERWATLAIPLAQPDRVHLTAAGYRRVAGWINSELMRGYATAMSAQPESKE